MAIMLTLDYALQWSDWYLVSRKDVSAKAGGEALMRSYPSLFDALKEIYLEHPWQVSRFVESGKLPLWFWNQKDHLLKALDNAEDRLSIKQVGFLGFE